MVNAPTTELGSAGGLPLLGVGSLRDAGRHYYEVEPWDTTPELSWPAASVIYDRMRRTDGQVAAVIRAVTLPILSASWRLTGDDVPSEIREFVAGELGLATPGEGRRRRRREGVVWRDHLRMALLSLSYGWMPFEQVYAVGPPAPGMTGPEQVAHLRKLAPRLPRTLTGPPRIDRDGGLAGIVQYLPDLATSRPASRDANPGEVFIPADRLVVYSLDREGADWTGNSLLRGSYKHWLIKDALLRLGPMVCERNGMGVPIVTYSEEAQKQDALDLAKGIRAGSEAGAAVPAGVAVQLLGVSGATRDELPLIKYHDEAAGRSALAMFLNLGHDNGARSLGDSFIDFFTASLNAVADQIAETATEHIIRDLVEINYGTDAPYPILEAEPISSETSPTAESLRTLADAGLLGPIDRDLQAEVRRRYDLPPIPESVTSPPPGGAYPPALDLVNQPANAGGASDIIGRLSALTQRVEAMHSTGLL